MNKIYALLAVLCISAQFSRANIYYVTNNHASGSGSIGSAITSSNSHAGKDSIYFNINSGTVAARTITLSADSILPNIKDSIVLDATTQPLGGHFGNSSAKIQITSSDYASTGLVLDVNAKGSGIYGLFITHFSTGIKLLADDFTFGSVNNGNVVSDCQDICVKVTSVTVGSIVAAFVGVDTSGSMGTSPNATGVLIDNCKKITMGGKQQNSRNIISGCLIGLKISDSKYITVQGNFIGTDLYGTIAVPNTTGLLTTETADGNTKNLTIGGDSAKYVNVISGNLQRGLDLDMASTTIEGNMIGTDLTGTLHLGNGGYGIYFRGGIAAPAHDNVVGGLNPGAGNVIAYNGQEAVRLEDAGAHNITIRGNKMYCNSQLSGAGGINLNGGNQGVVPPLIVIVSSDFVSGTTYPTAEIDLYAADSCNFCEGSTYLATIYADSNGVFADTLPITGKITATANDPFGNTSAFADCKDTANTSCIFASFFKSKNKVCTGDQLDLSDQTITIPGSSITSWNWNFGDGQTSTQQNPSVIYSAGGTYPITLVAGNDAGCSDTTVDSITVKDGVIIDFFADQDVCIGSPVHFTDNSFSLGSSYIVSWFWDLGDGSNSSFTDFLHTYDSVGHYHPTLYIVNNNNCSASLTDTIGVHDYPVADFHVAPDPCAVTPIEFTDNTNPAPGSPITSWNWNFGDGGTSIDQNATHLFTASGSYLVTLIVTDSFGCSDTTIQGVSILAGAIANFTWTSSGLTVNFINTSTFNAEYSMQWTFGDGSSSSLQTPTHTYNDFGSYEVCLIVNDYTCNMSDTLCQTVLITGINDVKDDSRIIVAPNPAYDFVEIYNLPSSPHSVITLLNSLGQEVLPEENLESSTQFRLLLPQLPEGVYTLQIKTSDGIVAKKLVISKN